MCLLPPSTRPDAQTHTKINVINILKEKAWYTPLISAQKAEAGGPLQSQPGLRRETPSQKKERREKIRKC